MGKEDSPIDILIEGDPGELEWNKDSPTYPLIRSRCNQEMTRWLEK